MSSWGLSSEIICSIIKLSISVIFAVVELSGFCSVVIVSLFLVLPEASLYTSFHGLDRDVAVQCCFHEFIFSFLMAAWYSVFALVYWFFLLSLSSLLFFVLCYSLLRAFVLFLIMLRASIHQGTDLPLTFGFGLFKWLHVFLHVNCIVSLNFAMNCLISFCSVNCAYGFSSMS